MPRIGKWFKRAGADDDVAARLYRTVVENARRPLFYVDYGVPDTQTGRFEMICLHVFPLLKRLKDLGPEGVALGQSVHDTMFKDLDRNFRELGVGDLGVGKRVKKLAAGLYGRIAAYEDGLGAMTRDGARDGAKDGDGALAAALKRNLYATVLDDDGAPLADGTSPGEAPITAMSAYLRRAVAAVEALPADALMDGDVSFPTPDPVGSGSAAMARRR